MDSDEMEAELARLRAKLADAEAALDAIRGGEVDAILVKGPGGDRVYTLESADESYRRLVEQMREGAVTLDAAGVILYCNPQFAHLVHMNSEQLLGTHFRSLVVPEDALAFENLVTGAGSGTAKGDIRLASPGGAHPVQLTIGRLEMRELGGIVIVATDLAEEKARTVTKQLVRRLLSVLAEKDPLTPARRRELGRTLAAEIDGSDVAPFFSAFQAMGLGELKLVKSENGRYTFHGNDMLDRVASSPTPTCHLVLGFVEGVVSALTRAPTLGTEIECQSQGRDRCVFVARAQPAR